MSLDSRLTRLESRYGSGQGTVADLVLCRMGRAQYEDFDWSALRPVMAIVVELPDESGGPLPGTVLEELPGAVFIRTVVVGEE